MSLSDVELASAVEDIAHELRGAHIAKVRATGPRSFLLVTRGEGILLSARPRAGRVHLVGHDLAPAETEPPTPFLLSLRAELRSARLAELVATPGDRIATLVFERPSGPLHLIAELTAQPNLVLVADDKVVAALHLAGKRALDVGAVYLPPVAGDRRPPWLGQDRFGPTPSARIAEHYANVELELDLDELRRRLDTDLHRARTRTMRLLQALDEDQERARLAEGYRKLGDLLLAHLHDVPRGARAVTLPDDFGDGAPLTIELDPARSPSDNATRYYQQHKKLAGSLTLIQERRAAASARASVLDKLLARVNLATTLADLGVLALEVDRVAPSAVPRSGRDARHERERRALPFHEFVSSAGDAIWVGKGARANDELTFRHARGNDLWLHARDRPGAHVVVRLERGRTVVEQTLLDAATLAVHYSQAKDETDADVAYTYRKYVRRVAKDAPGLVTLANAKTFRVRMDRPRLTRLLAQRPPAR